MFHNMYFHEYDNGTIIYFCKNNYSLIHSPA